VRLLAVIGQAYGAAGSWEPANEVLSEALNIASHISDPKLMARVLGARSTVDYHFLQLREAAADGEKAGSAETGPWERAVNLQYLCQTLLCLGRLGDEARIRDELEPLAKKIGQSYTIARCLIGRAWVEFGKEPDLDKLENILQQALKTDPKGPFFWDVFFEIQLTLVDFFRGDWASALFHAQASCRLEVEGSLHGIGAGTLFRQLAYAGDYDGALAMLREKRTCLPRIGQRNTMGSWWMHALVIEGLFILGEHSQARELYPLTRELVATGAVALWPIFRFTHTVAGMAAAAAREWEAAEDYFLTAMQRAESFPHVLEQAEIRRLHAMMLIDRAAPGDHGRARAFLNDALQSYERIRMPGHVVLARALLDKSS
jgi:tetratricopeptide (TPR) repeat protein